MDVATNRLPCATCRRRKVRCSKTQPCANCARAGIDCYYEDDQSTTSRVAARSVNADLMNRLVHLARSLESLTRGSVRSSQTLHDKSAKLNDSTTATALNGPPDMEHLVKSMEEYVQGLERSTEQDRHMSHTGKLCYRGAQARYVRETFWAGLYNEVENLSFLLKKPVSARESHDASRFSHFQQNSNPIMLTIPREVSDFLVDQFMSNVDPFFRLLHKPRFKLDLNQFHRHEESFAPNREEFQALLFSIYAFASHSLHDEDAMIYFGESKDTIIRRFAAATKEGLKNVDVLSTHSITTLTAFALYITLLSEIDGSNLEWTSLSGLSLSIATRLGLHQDGAKFGLSPYAVEIRRRLWHHLCWLNVRALQIHAIEPFPVSALANDGPKYPQNSPDEAWDACEFSRKLPTAVPGWTEMVPALVAFELSTLRRSVLETSIPEHGSENAYLNKCDQLLRDTKARLDRYQSQGSLDEPIHKVTNDLIGLNLQSIWFITRHCLLKHRTWATHELRIELFRKALHISETSHILENEYYRQHWGWLFRSFRESNKWHLVSTMLVYLRSHTRQEDLEVQRAWDQVDFVFNQRGDDQSALWEPLVALRREAEIRRDEDVTLNNKDLTTLVGDGLWLDQTDSNMLELNPVVPQWGSEPFLEPGSGHIGDFYSDTR